MPQYDALLRLSLAGGTCLRMGEVADALLFSSGAATKVFDRLVERGLVERGADPDDRRTVLVGLTDEGRALFARAQRAHGDSIHDKLGPFASADERRHVEAFLKRLASTEARHRQPPRPVAPPRASGPFRQCPAQRRGISGRRPAASTGTDFAVSLVPPLVSDSLVARRMNEPPFQGESSGPV